MCSVAADSRAGGSLDRSDEGDGFYDCDAWEGRESLGEVGVEVVGVGAGEGGDEVRRASGR